MIICDETLSLAVEKADGVAEKQKRCICIKRLAVFCHDLKQKQKQNQKIKIKIKNKCNDAL